MCYEIDPEVAKVIFTPSHTHFAKLSPNSSLKIQHPLTPEKVMNLTKSSKWQVASSK